MGANISFEELDALARDNIQGIFERVTGLSPNTRLSNKTTKRYGRKGGWAVEVFGPNKGRITPFDGHGKGLSPFQFIQEELGADYFAGVSWLKSYFNLADDWKPDPRAAKRHAEKAEQKRHQAEAEAEADRRRRISIANRLVRQSVPLENTDAEAYLRRRLITGPLPDIVRYHPGSSSLLLIATLPDGSISAVQRVYLKGDQKDPAHAEVPKRTNGPQGNAAVRLPGTGDTLYMCEGPETALSVWLATGAPTWAMLGQNFGGRDIPDGIKNIVIAADNAYPHEQAFKQADAAAGEYFARGYRVLIARARGEHKSDFNDVLQERGVDDVRAELDAAVEWGGVPAIYPAPVGTVDEAREATKVEIAAWANSDSLKPVFIKAATGVGKSWAIRQRVSAMVKDMPAGMCIVIATPTHKLNAEYRLAMEGVDVEVYRGREADDPDNLPSKMCRLHVEAAKISSAGGNPSDLCAEFKDEELISSCPHFQECNFIRQKTLKPQVWIVPHIMLIRQPPSFFLGIHALIVDEDPTMVFLSGPVRVSRDELAATRMLRDGAAASADLEAVRSAVQRAIYDLDHEAALRIEDINIDTDDAYAASRAIWKDKQSPDINPAMSRSERAEVTEAAAVQNRPIKRLSRLYRLIAQAKEFGREIVPGCRQHNDCKGRDGETFSAFQMRWKAALADKWYVKTIIMSATADVELLRMIWPQVEQVADLSPAMPHAHVRQITWSASKNKFERDNNYRRVRNYIEARSTGYASVLVIAQMDVEGRLNALGLPPNVETAHFNDVEGIDKWKNVECVIAIGRPLPGPLEVEMIAEVLTGVRPAGDDLPGGWYPRPSTGIRMRGKDGGPGVEAECHPDAVVEAVRRNICEGAVIQAIGRGRGVNRTADDPLQIDIIGTLTFPIEVDEVLTWDQAQADPIEVMAARGILIESDLSEHGVNNVVAAVLPDRFKDNQAVKDWRKSLTGGNANKNIYISKSPREDWVRAKVRREGDRYAVLIQHKRGEPFSLPEQGLEGVLDDIGLYQVVPIDRSGAATLGRWAIELSIKSRAMSLGDWNA